jgi:hypothetical protein
MTPRRGNHWLIVGLRAALALGSVIGVTGCGRGHDPQPPHTRTAVLCPAKEYPLLIGPRGQLDARGLVGLTEGDARGRAREYRCKLTIEWEDGRQSILNARYDVREVLVSIRRGHVVNVRAP